MLCEVPVCTCVCPVRMTWANTGPLDREVGTGCCWQSQDFSLHGCWNALAAVPPTAAEPGVRSCPKPGSATLNCETISKSFRRVAWFFPLVPW